MSASEGAGSKLKQTAALRSRSSKVCGGWSAGETWQETAGQADKTAAAPTVCFLLFLFFFFLNAASDTLLNAQLSNASLRLPLMLALKVCMASPL